MSNSRDPLDSMGLKHPRDLLVGLDYELVVHFFCVFSRFEHALKMNGYLRRGELACPAWRRFAQDMAGRLSPIPSNKLRDSIAFLIERPPKQQLRSLEWVENPPPAECVDSDSKAIVAATGVRNNLFHGGKYKPTDPVRDEKLILSALDVVHGCLYVRGDIKEHYEMVL